MPAAHLKEYLKYSRHTDPRSFGIHVVPRKSKNISKTCQIHIQIRKFSQTTWIDTSTSARDLWQVVKVQYQSMQLEDLLGHPLNDVEMKFKPKMIFCKGSMEIPLPSPRVSIIGSRNASEKGIKEAKTIAKSLVENNVIIVSGLAKGIDTAGHKTVIKYGGKTIAVIGTPLDRVYPRENASLQDEIMKNHLVVSQYQVGSPITKKNFVLRNKTMALISDATVIVEAGESSGSLHQGWETLRTARPLFICKDVVENELLNWPRHMIKYGAMTFDDPSDILENLSTDIKMIPELL